MVSNFVKRLRCLDGVWFINCFSICVFPLSELKEYQNTTNGVSGPVVSLSVTSVLTTFSVDFVQYHIMSISFRWFQRLKFLSSSSSLFEAVLIPFVERMRKSYIFKFEPTLFIDINNLCKTSGSHLIVSISNFSVSYVDMTLTVHELVVWFKYHSFNDLRFCVSLPSTIIMFVY